MCTNVHLADCTAYLSLIVGLLYLDAFFCYSHLSAWHAGMDDDVQPGSLPVADWKISYMVYSLGASVLLAGSVSRYCFSANLWLPTQLQHTHSQVWHQKAKHMPACSNALQCSSNWCDAAHVANLLWLEQVLEGGVVLWLRYKRQRIVC